MASSNSSNSSCRQQLSLAQKLEMIKAVDSGKLSMSAVAKEFGVAKSTVSSVMKNKHRLVDASDVAHFTPGRKRLRLASHSDIEEALLIWF